MLRRAALSVLRRIGAALFNSLSLSWRPCSAGPPRPQHPKPVHLIERTAITPGQANRGARDLPHYGTPPPPGGPRRPPTVPSRPRAPGAPPAERPANGGPGAPAARRSRRPRPGAHATAPGPARRRAAARGSARTGRATWEESGPFVEASDLLPAELVHQGLEGRVRRQDREPGEPLVLRGSAGHLVGQAQEPPRVDHRAPEGPRGVRRCHGPGGLARTGRTCRTR